jgi:hypothetical protein
MHVEALGSVFFSFKLSCALKSVCLVIGLKGGQSTLFSGVSGVLLLVLETPNEVIILTPGRTNNRIRSPRLAASGV